MLNKSLPLDSKVLAFSYQSNPLLRGFLHRPSASPNKVTGGDALVAAIDRGGKQLCRRGIHGPPVRPTLSSETATRAAVSRCQRSGPWRADERCRSLVWARTRSSLQEGLSWRPFLWRSTGDHTRGVGRDPRRQGWIWTRNKSRDGGPLQQSTFTALRHVRVLPARLRDLS
jgi:hypothetical protein